MVAYAILFTVEVTLEILNKVAATVLRMEEVGKILIGDRNFTITEYTGIFKTNAATWTKTDGKGSLLSPKTAVLSVYWWWVLPQSKICCDKHLSLMNALFVALCSRRQFLQCD